MKFFSRLYAPIGLGFSFLVCACGDRPVGAAGDGNSPVVQNNNPRLAKEAAWKLSPSPAVEITSDFAGIAGAVRLTNGRVVIADRGSQTLRMFDTHGAHLRDIGRVGEGPGEFRGLDGVALLRGDSIAAWDLRLRRLSVFDPTGRMAREMAPRDLGLFPRFKGVLNDGSVVLTAGVHPGRSMVVSTAPRRDSVTYLRFSPGGVLLDTLGKYPGAETVMLMSTGAMTMEEVVFGRDFHLVVGRDRYYGADDDRFELTEYRLPATPVRRIYKRHPPRQVSDADLARFLKQPRDVSGVPPQLRAQLAKRNPGVPHRPTLPAFESLLLDAEGYLWVEHPRVTEAESGRWDVFDREGKWVTTVATPAGYRVLQIGRDFTLGTARDTLDVEHVHLYTLSR
jgi:hypothetical protein